MLDTVMKDYVDGNVVNSQKRKKEFKILQETLLLQVAGNNYNPHAQEQSGANSRPRSGSNALLGSLMVFATFLTLCNAQCYVIPAEKIPGNTSSECKDLDGVKHPLNSKWKTKTCEMCSCKEDGIHCCSIITTPVGYDTTKCWKTFNKETCSYTVVEQKDPGKTCPVSQWIK
ncbi:PREDICTED: beta-microseminoprotein [Galeopterus variegatus]|uniref:Beta-microseminoprotein n=1 Tax=Galeopterus variegatus TaxID=482537 RepID=A0ABM0QIN5_GALVR|nr:PREDICTED: beta-microseminoprotein [Galeopterus variegatus]